MSAWGAIGSAIAGPAIGFLSDRYGQKKAINHQTGEREAAEAFSAQQAAEQRAWASNQASVDRRFQRLEAEKARLFSSDEAKAAREFSAQEAMLNRQFQEMMASTQFSRATEDLKRAGLNRILALGQPAASASGSAAQGIAASASVPSGRGVSGASATSSGGSTGTPSYGATQAAMIRNLIDLQTAQSIIKKQKAETDFIRAQTDKTKADTGFSEIKGFIGNFLKEFFGGEGTTGKQAHDAIRPFVDKLVKLVELDRKLKGYLKTGAHYINEKARDNITTIKIQRGNDADKHNRRR